MQQKASKQEKGLPLVACWKRIPFAVLVTPQGPIIPGFFPVLHIRHLGMPALSSVEISSGLEPYGMWTGTLFPLPTAVIKQSRGCTASGCRWELPPAQASMICRGSWWSPPHRCAHLLCGGILACLWRSLQSCEPPPARWRSVKTGRPDTGCSSL